MIVGGGRFVDGASTWDIDVYEVLPDPSAITHNHYQDVAADNTMYFSTFLCCRRIMTEPQQAKIDICRPLLAPTFSGLDHC